MREERGGHRGRASREWIQDGGGPPTQEPSTRKGSSGGQQGLGEEGGDIGEETPRTEQHQAIFLRTKLRHILRTLRIKDHETEGPLEKDLHWREERDLTGVTPYKTKGQQGGSGASARAESKNHKPQGALG